MSKKQRIIVEFISILKTKKGLLPIFGVIIGVCFIFIAICIDDINYHLLRIILTEFGTLSITVLGVHLLYNIYLKKEDLEDLRSIYNIELVEFYKKIQHSLSCDLSKDITRFEHYILDDNYKNIFSAYLATQKHVLFSLLNKKQVSFDFSSEYNYERRIFDYVYINCLDVYKDSSFSGLSRLSDGYYWSMDENELTEVEKHIKLIFANTDPSIKNMKRVFIYDDEITDGLKRILDLQVKIGVIVKIISNNELKRKHLIIHDYFFYENEGKVFWTVHYTQNKGEIYNVELSTVSINYEEFARMKNCFEQIWDMAQNYSRN